MKILVTFNWDGCIRFTNSDTDEVLDARPILFGLESGVLKIVQSSVDFENFGDDIIKMLYMKSETWIIERV